MSRKKSGCWSALIQLAIIACVSLSVTTGIIAWMAASEGTSLSAVMSTLLKGQRAPRPAAARPTISSTRPASAVKAPPSAQPPPGSAQPSFGTPAVAANLTPPTLAPAGEAISTPGPAAAPTPAALPAPANGPPAAPVSPSAAPDAGPPFGVQAEEASMESPIRAGSALPERQATRLVIQALGLDVPVVLSPIVSQTWQVSQLGKDFVGHLEGTASPGDPSNVVLAGHVTLAHNVYGPFAGLGKLQPSDVIVVYVGEQPYTYVVDNRQMVNRTDIQVAYPTRTARITLITCTDWSNELKTYQKRLIVVGHLAQ
jgi:LPXTG-site transpeptidase (sortase) family protein